MNYSTTWKNWIAELDVKVCLVCDELHGKIFPIAENPKIKPPIHLACRCVILPMYTMSLGRVLSDKRRSKKINTKCKNNR